MNLKLVRVSVLLLLCAISLWAAMSDPAAAIKAQQTWGSQAWIGYGRQTNASNWTRIVGFKSGGCQQPYQPVGTGFNTWDEAFADAAMHPWPVIGPFAGTVHLQATAFDNIAVSAVRFHVDSSAYQQVLADQLQQTFLARFDFDTTRFPNGLHVICAQAYDTSDNSGSTARPTLLLVNQTIGIANATVSVGQMANAK